MAGLLNRLHAEALVQGHQFLIYKTLKIQAQRAACRKSVRAAAAEDSAQVLASHNPVDARGWMLCCQGCERQEITCSRMAGTTTITDLPA
ncbi:hypothetical protein LJR129_005190 [Acidovorax sp. LjRoot129]|uniref:hypothetical protein n=1 Tax=Acidovorax sp. LjRoot129 TaxID=3342260 RepID=UPI003ECF9054